MIRTLVLASRALCLAAALLCIVQIAAAADLARAFAGTYKISNIVEDGSQVHLTMTLTLLNPGAADIKGGIVAVLNSQPNPTLIGSFSAIKTLPHQGQVTVIHTFTLARAEYANWQQGHVPRL